MEVQKEAFVGLLEYYKNLPTEVKRSEIINEFKEIISNYSKMCSKLGVMPNMMLNKEILVDKESITEDEFLHAIYAYLNTLQDINAQFLNKICDILEKDNIF